MYNKELSSALNNLGISDFTILGNKIIVNKSVATSNDLGQLNRDIIVKGSVFLKKITKDLVMNTLKCDKLDISSQSGSLVSIKSINANNCKLSKVTLVDTKATGVTFKSDYGSSYVNCILDYKDLVFPLDSHTVIKNTSIHNSETIMLYNYESSKNKGSLLIQDTKKVTLVDELNISIHFSNVESLILSLDGKSTRNKYTGLKLTGDIKNLELVRISKSVVTSMGILDNLQYKSVKEVSDYRYF